MSPAIRQIDALPGFENRGFQYPAFQPGADGSWFTGPGSPGAPNPTEPNPRTPRKHKKCFLPALKNRASALDIR
jgi:hypothetical protein